jgi:hypothetical protein
MFGFISALLSAIVSITPQAIAERRKSRERELVARLFRICLITHDIADRGYRIIEILKMARAVMNSPNYEAEYWWTSRLSKLLESQSQAFSTLEKEVVAYGTCLATLDPETFGALRQLLLRKEANIRFLVELLLSHEFPLEAPGEQVEGQNTTTVDDAVISLARLMSFPPDWPREISVIEKPDRETVAKIEAYLNESGPERDLAEIREMLKTLRKALDDNFKVSEILLELVSLTSPDPDYSYGAASYYWMPPEL